MRYNLGFDANYGACDVFGAVNSRETSRSSDFLQDQLVAEGKMPFWGEATYVLLVSATRRARATCY